MSEICFILIDKSFMCNEWIIALHLLSKFCHLVCILLPLQHGVITCGAVNIGYGSPHIKECWGGNSWIVYLRELHKANALIDFSVILWQELKAPVRLFWRQWKTLVYGWAFKVSELYWIYICFCLTLTGTKHFWCINILATEFEILNLFSNAIQQFVCLRKRACS
jgi:hypothetical protein